MSCYDVVIIGSGPAGIEASLLLKRANVNPLVIGKESVSLKKAPKIQNYYGTGEISGTELQQKGIKQARDLGIEVLEEEVISISMFEDYLVKTSSNEYHGKTILLATGANRSIPNIKGIKEFDGRGISYCATCDGFFYREKKVGIIGNGDYALSEAEYLSSLAKEIIILSDGKEIKANNLKVSVNSKKIKEICGEAKVNSVVFEDGSKVELDGVFIAYAIAGSFDFAKQIGAELDGNKVKTNEKMETSVPGLYMAGDCTGGIMQINNAVYQGARAATSIISYLKTLK